MHVCAHVDVRTHKLVTCPPEDSKPPEERMPEVEGVETSDGVELKWGQERAREGTAMNNNRAKEGTDGLCETMMCETHNTLPLSISLSPLPTALIPFINAPDRAQRQDEFHPAIKTPPVVSHIM